MENPFLNRVVFELKQFGNWNIHVDAIAKAVLMVLLTSPLSMLPT
jgi:hypothetical protein